MNIQASQLSVVSHPYNGGNSGGESIVGDPVDRLCPSSPQVPDDLARLARAALQHQARMPHAGLPVNGLNVVAGAASRGCGGSPKPPSTGCGSDPAPKPPPSTGCGSKPSPKP